MATILKCKICGGDIEVSQDMTIGTCLFCGSTMTLPKIDSDKKARLFNRAHEYRLNCEFDKAYDAYKSIVDEDEQEAEAYWGMLLSEYGIEYVDDPRTGKKKPTCHRAQTKSIKDSTNYRFACKYADTERKFMYKDEADVIDSISKRIISISVTEEPYDVFICYKETDDKSGDRTEDSVLAQSIYTELEKNGMRTFFSRITLEDKLGKDYEPYIFSALNSAKVMLVVTTSRENCNSVWVRNEWSRFLSLMSNDSPKNIIPVYKNITPYELPDELVGYQAQNAEKIGAIQDIVYGVQKLIGKSVSNGSIEDREILKTLLNEKKKNDIRKKYNRVLFVGVVVALVCGMTGYRIYNYLNPTEMNTNHFDSKQI